ncbi:5'-methylthioadenosine/S-adenosylhomocysteine nucleosidase [Actinoplanes bogorensis]|uniref:5'-methylthioadenosine/S-adenosylhomocysteine nucleosidase n=1 Tax=Paractinoplanes bogorensis TaxID=1610840 RepID=A0ABS5YYB1_9ACTN|nr:5'-methylthioadenosine/S-adenosylhomocysteine nucleosidase [Actinoplanes bogorensis]MBU2668426.1 5'-methylthioadenosine/S-adenosylhomocysteine nucleosidase [Actinoplanes bogorensis]
MDSAAQVVVLTAKQVEYDAIRSHLRDLRRHSDSAGTQFEVGTLEGTSARVAIVEVGPGNVGAALMASSAISTFQPRALLFVGVAGALTDLDVGAVVVATKVYAYDGGREQDDGYAARPQAFDADHELLQRARFVARTFHLRPGAPVVEFGAVAAGDVVLDSRTTLLAQKLRRHYNDASAIEMESAGMARAAGMGRVGVLTIRGISDRADGGKAEADAAGSQQVAATNAAAFAAALIADYLSSPTPTPTSPPPVTAIKARASRGGLPVRVLVAIAAATLVAIAVLVVIHFAGDDGKPPAVAACDYKMNDPGVVEVKPGAATPGSMTLCPALLNNGVPLTKAFTVAGRFGGPAENYRDLVVVGRADPKVCDVYGNRPVPGYFYQASLRVDPDGHWSFRDGVGYDEAVTLARDYQFVTGTADVLAAIRSDRSRFAEQNNGDDGYTGMAELPADARVVATFRQPSGTYEGKGPAPCK